MSLPPPCASYRRRFPRASSSSSLNSPPRRRFFVAPSPASRQSYRCATTRSRVATPAVILSRFAPARCPPHAVHRQVHHLAPSVSLVRAVSSRLKFPLCKLSPWPPRRLASAPAAQVISLNGVKRPKLPDRPKQVTDAPPRYQYRTCPLGIPMSMSMYRFNIALLELPLRFGDE